MSSQSVLASLLKQSRNVGSVLDLGCGDGRSIDLFRRLLPDVAWTGVDIAKSPEVDLRQRTDGEFVT